MELTGTGESTESATRPPWPQWVTHTLNNLLKLNVNFNVKLWEKKTKIVRSALRTSYRSGYKPWEHLILFPKSLEANVRNVNMKKRTAKFERCTQHCTSTKFQVKIFISHCIRRTQSKACTNTVQCTSLAELLPQNFGTHRKFLRMYRRNACARRLIDKL